MKRLTVAALLAAASIAAPASAAPLLFDFVSDRSYESVSFTLDSNQTPTFTNPYFITFSGVELTALSGTAFGDVSFSSTTGGGGFSAGASRFLYIITEGAQLYSGEVTSPIFNAGSYKLTGFGTSAGGTLTIKSVGAAVPEPATWALMILGFGAVGAAMRRRQSVKMNVRYA